MNREQKEELEYQRLHPAAVKAAETQGRAFPEPQDRWRTCLERDRDRILHSTAFRRLEYKTQVFVNHVGDHHRTRLTHSLEVMQVARSMASVLDLNDRLVEAVALGHDLGHPPYGHAGEKALDERLKEQGGFSHNRQSVRVVTRLERRSPAYRGLNLSREVVECLKKHEVLVDPDTGERIRFPMLEAQLVDLADSTAYHYHDVDDGIRAGILDPRRMEEDLELWNASCSKVLEELPDSEEGFLFWRRATNEMLGLTIGDILGESRARLETANPGSPHEAQAGERRIVAHSEALRSQVAALHEYLYEHMYYDERVNWHVRRATDLLEHLFDAILAQPDIVPERYREHADTTERAICDYLAGMTDRYVERIARDLRVLPG